MDESKMGQPAVDNKEYKKDDYDAKAEELETLNQEDISSMDEDEAMEVLQKKKQLKAEMKGLEGVAEDEAIVENGKHDEEALKKSQQETADLADKIKAEDELKIGEIEEKLGIKDNESEMNLDKKNNEELISNLKEASAIFGRMGYIARFDIPEEQKFLAKNKEENFLKRKEELITLYDKIYGILYGGDKNISQTDMMGEEMRRVANSNKFSEIKGIIGEISEKGYAIENMMELIAKMAQRKVDTGNNLSNDFHSAQNKLNSILEMIPMIQQESDKSENILHSKRDEILGKYDELMKLVFTYDNWKNDAIDSSSTAIQKIESNMKELKGATKAKEAKNILSDSYMDLRLLAKVFEIAINSKLK